MVSKICFRQKSYSDIFYYLVGKMIKKDINLSIQAKEQSCKSFYMKSMLQNIVIPFSRLMMIAHKYEPFSSLKYFTDSLAHHFMSLSKYWTNEQYLPEICCWTIHNLFNRQQTVDNALRIIAFMIAWWIKYPDSDLITRLTHKQMKSKISQSLKEEIFDEFKR